MEVIFVMSIFHIIYGMFGLFGKRNVEEKFRGYEWTRSYMKEMGIGDILLGVPWLILYFAFSQYDPGYLKMFLLIIFSALPSLIYVICTERKYLKLIRKE